ncbi:MAG: hypothetical protein SGI77_16760 [Pirellulaceae bacterium]|nr:hypothetical protein [Pirellulaceae bacterium]
MVEAARTNKRIVQHGTQCQSSANIVEGIQKLHQGIIGDVYFARGIAYKVRGSHGKHEPAPVPKGLDWDAGCGPAPIREYSSFNQRRWHWIWDFGNGEIGNQGVHQIDILRWGLKLDTHPETVSARLSGRCDRSWQRRHDDLSGLFELPHISWKQAYRGTVRLPGRKSHLGYAAFQKLAYRHSNAKPCRPISRNS